MTYRNKALVIEKDELMRSFIRNILTKGGYEVLTASAGEYGRAVIESHCPDIVTIDLELPDIDGTEVIRSVRKWSSLPVVVISSRAAESEKVRAFEAGADDYITKPFGANELLARMKTALRHTRTASEDNSVSVKGIFRTGELTIDYGKNRVYVREQDINLTRNEYKIVSLLGRNAGKVIRYDLIIRYIWGPHAKQDNQILRVNMSNIRRKIEKSPGKPEYIFTEAGVGYRMADGDPAS